MYLVLKRDWEALDASKPEVGDRQAVIPRGRHEIERVPNPYAAKGFLAPWLVLKGTLIGGTEGFWRQWENETLVSDPRHPDFGKPIVRGEYEVLIED